MAAYLGGPEVALSSVVLEPEHSLVVQAYAPKEMLSGTVNVDGFGVGWYVPDGQSSGEVDPEPAVYRSNDPIWTDRSFAGIAPKLRSRAVFAAVRDATPGLPAEESGVPPFAAGPYTFMHNGAVEDFRSRAMRPLREALSDESYAMLLGVSDSETVFAGLLDRILGRNSYGSQEPMGLAAAAAETVRQVSALGEKLGLQVTLNLGVTDGVSMAFTRYSLQGPGNSLYYLEDGGSSPGAVVVASERLDGDPGWTAVPDRHLLLVRGPDSGVELHPLQTS